MKEEDIRPEAIFDEFLRLAEKDIANFFCNVEQDNILCPACKENGNFAFEKAKFRYELCNNCLSLYVSPRPRMDSFKAYYRESESTKFWSEVFYSKTAEARIEKIWMPKADFIFKKIHEIGIHDNYEIYDIGGGYGLFAEAFLRISHKFPIVIEPGFALAEETRKKGFFVISKFLEEVRRDELSDKQKVFVNFELFEHLHDPEKFLENIFSLQNSGDILIFTTLSSIGFDIQLLWDKSKSVYPPHHLNFLNPDSIRILLSRIGFIDIEVSTPGKLDVDIVSKNLVHVNDRFWNTFFQISDASMEQDLQDFLSKNLLSSHMMIICRKP